MDQHNVANLLWARQRVREAAGAKGGSWCVGHFVRHIPGEPRLAAALTSRFRENGVPWGFTVIPHDEGHLAVFHYCTLLPKGMRARRDLQKKERALIADIIGEDDSLLTRMVSRLLLRQCEDLCLSPAAWAAYPERTREGIRDMFQVRILGGVPAHADHAFLDTINLFA